MTSRPLTRILARLEVASIKDGYYVFSGTLKGPVDTYDKNTKVDTEEPYFGAYTSTDLRSAPNGQYAIVHNEKDKYFSLLSAKQAAELVKKSVYLGSGEEGRKICDLYVHTIRWHRSANDRVRDLISKLDIPAKFKKCPATILYRGTHVPNSLIKRLKNGETLQIPLRGAASSWSSKLQVAKDFAEYGEEGSGKPVVLKKMISPKDVILNIPSLMLFCTHSKEGPLDFDDEGEILVRNSDAIKTVSLKNLIEVDRD